MLFKLCKTLAMACVALIIAQSSALSFTLEVAGKIDNVTDPVKKAICSPINSCWRCRCTASRPPPPGRRRGSLKDFGGRHPERVGAKGETLTFYALNDYYIDVPLSDVKKYNMILAYKMDGEMLKLRNFGPLFLVYPRDAAGPELNSPLYNSRFIWQVDRIVIK